MPKIKFSEELKLQAVLEYLKGCESQKTVARKYCVAVGDLQKWLLAYQEHGADGLIIRQNNHKKYDGEFKVKVVEYMHTHNYSARQTAAHFNIPSYVTVCQWEKKYLKGGVSSLFTEQRGRKLGMKPKKITKRAKKEIEEESKEDLIEEVKRLRMENEYLKKLNALIQKREKSEESTK